MSEQLYFEHYGTKRHSGRYPWGSGENPFQHDKTGFYKEYRAKKDEGLTESQIAAYFDTTYYGGNGKFTTTQLRAYVTIGKEQQNAENLSRVMELKQKGLSQTAIAEKMGVNESVVRSWLTEDRQSKINSTRKVADAIKADVDSKKYIDVGLATERQLGVSKQKLDTAIAMLEEEGYTKHMLKIEQQGNLGNFTWVPVLAKDDVSYSEIRENMDKIQPLGYQSNDHGETIIKTPKPTSISSKRVQIRYAEDGGLEKDGVIEIRPGVADLSLGDKNYAQVRIAVDDDYYLKGMAIYNNNLPKGVDIIFNTNKTSDVPMLNGKNGVLKPMKKDSDLPFGALTKTADNYIDKDGKEQQSAINKVNEDEDWDKWSKTLASQFLSKQDTSLAKRQLGLAYDTKESEFETLASLTNPTLKKKLLMEFADECDSAAVKLKAAPLPGQATKVILPVTSLKDNEIYAPGYKNGEEVVLVRYPHAGPFESPRLIVNNRNREGREMMGNDAPNAVGINSKVAEQLSGADFDGDTAVVIPTRGVNIKTKSRLNDLKDFEPKIQYKAYEGMPEVGPETGFRKQLEMGKVSNLITDMTIKGATEADIAKAVKHSMVVIDAEKHNLDWRRSFEENDIAYLKEKYQGGKNRGASTLISRASSEASEIKRKEVYSTTSMTPQQLKDYKAGKKVYGDPEEVYIKPSKAFNKMTDAEKESYYKARDYYKETGKVPPAKDGISYKEVARTYKTTKMAKAEDARELISTENTVMENIYADHANKLKALALEARKEARATPKMEMNKSAKEAYANEVKSLNDKLATWESYKPLERQAQLIANKRMKVWLDANPDATKEEEKKHRNKFLSQARLQTSGGNKHQFELTDREWEAIQSGAISDSKMMSILNATDQDKLRDRATPKSRKTLNKAQIARAKAFINKGYTQQEVAEFLGVSASTISKSIKD